MSGRRLNMTKVLHRLFQNSPSRRSFNKGASGGRRTANSSNLLTRRKTNTSSKKISAQPCPFLRDQEFPVIITNSELRNVHPFVGKIFRGLMIPQVSLGGRLKYFVKSWEKLTRGQNILGVIPFKNKPVQK